jgi:ethanolamine utilization protein EutA (predicted chaperonin)
MWIVVMVGSSCVHAQKNRPGYRAVDESSWLSRWFYGTTGRRTGVQQQQIQALVARECIDATVSQETMIANSMGGFIVTSGFSARTQAIGHDLGILPVYSWLAFGPKASPQKRV